MSIPNERHVVEVELVEHTLYPCIRYGDAYIQHALLLIGGIRGSFAIADEFNMRSVFAEKTALELLPDGTHDGVYPHDAVIVTFTYVLQCGERPDTGEPAEYGYEALDFIPVPLGDAIEALRKERHVWEIVVPDSDQEES